MKRLQESLWSQIHRMHEASPQLQALAAFMTCGSGPSVYSSTYFSNPPREDFWLSLNLSICFLWHVLKLSPLSYARELLIKPSYSKGEFSLMVGGTNASQSESLMLSVPAIHQRRVLIKRQKGKLCVT